MDKIVAIVTRVPKQLKNDDDTVDRLSHRFTVVILVSFCVVISMQQYVGKPITCWAPKHFTGSHTKFMNSFCWVKNTYFLPFDREIPKKNEHHKRHELLYYQWLPFVFLTQAFLFYLPRVLWHAMNQKSGVDTDNIMDSALRLADLKKTEKREKILTLITNQLDRLVSTRHLKSTKWYTSLSRILSTVCIMCGKSLGNYLVVLYIFVKIMYLANAIVQLHVLNVLLGTAYNLYGFELLGSLSTGHGWGYSSTFPPVTMCDFEIRILGNVQRYTVQCVLPINIYVERMYAFLWFWIVLVIFFTAISLLTWIVRAIHKGDRLVYIRGHLDTLEILRTDGDRRMVKEFVDHYLKQDGVFILRLIGHNTDMITINEVIGSLWRLFLQRRQETLPLKPTTEEESPMMSAPPPINPDYQKQRPVGKSD